MEEEAYTIAQQVKNMHTSLSNINKKLDDHTQIIIQCYQIGNMKTEQFKDFQKLLSQSFKDITISQDNLKQIKGKLSPYLKTKDWNQPLLNLSFQESVIQTEWPGFELYMKANGAIALYDADTNDMSQFKEEYTKLKNKLSQNRQSLLRLFIMGGQENKIRESIQFEQQFCILEDIEIEREACQVLVEISINMAQDLDKLKSDPQNVVLVHMKEEKVTDSSKMKKRKEGRALKMMGDYCLMLLSFDDAVNYYIESMKILKKSDDFLWLAGCQTSTSASIYYQYKYKCFATEQGYIDFEKEFNLKMKEALQFILKTKFTHFFIEIAFKYIKALAEFQFKLQYNEIVQYFESNYQSNDKVESSQCFQQIAMMYKLLNMFRKYGFYLRKAALLIMRENTNVCQKLMSIAAKYYKFYELSPFGEGKKSEQFWLTIQIAFLNDFIECLADQPRLKNQLKKHVINVFTQLNSVHQEKLYQNLRETCPLMTRYDYFLFQQMPMLKRIEIIPSHQLIRPNEQEKQGLFIYNPFQNRKLQKLKFPQDELINFRITLLNGFGFDLQIDSIVFEVSGVEVLNYPNNVFVSKNHKEIILEQNLKALQSGNLSIEGLRIRTFNTVYEHCIDERGFGILYIDKFQDNLKLEQDSKRNMYDLKNIEIFDKLPHLTAELQGDFDQSGNIIFEKSQKLQFQIYLKNTGDLPITKIRIQACIDFAQPPIQEFQYSFEDIGDVEINKNENLTLIFIEQNSIFKQKKGNFKVIHLPLLKQSSFEVTQVTFMVSYMENTSSKFIKEIQLRKNISVKESILIDSIDIYEQDQKIIEDLRAQNFYLNDYFYVQVTFIKTGDGENQLQQQDENHILGIEHNAYIIDNQFTLTFFEKEKNIDQCDLYSNNKRVTKIFKLKKIQKLEEEQDEEDSDPLEYMQRKFRDIFCIKWKDVHRYSEGILPLPNMNSIQLKKIFLQPIQIETQLKLVSEDNQVQTYSNEYTIRFKDLTQISLSNSLSCELRLENIISGGQELVSFHTYYVLDGKTRYNINLRDIQNKNHDNLAEHKGFCHFKVYGQSQKRQFIFCLTIVDNIKRVNYNFSENVTL